MHRPLIVLALACVLGAASTLLAQQPVPAASFAIEHVSVIDIETGRRAPDQTVVVRGNRIAAVGGANSVAVPDDARIVDGRGKFLIPGIWDMHVHAMRSASRILPLAVANGITGLRDMGAPDGEHRQRAGRDSERAGVSTLVRRRRRPGRHRNPAQWTPATPRRSYS